jgi:hypothetical protein
MVENRPESQSWGKYQIEGVPKLMQGTILTCGYTSLSMVLQYYGNSEGTPHNIYENIHGPYDNLNEHFHAKPAPMIETLADVAKEFTFENIPLKSRVIGEKDYQDIKQKNPNLAGPHDVLKYFIKGDIPMIVRTPGHFMVATGVNLSDNSYTFNDPLRGVRNIPANIFENDWSRQDPKYTRDTRHLMLAIYPQRRKET